MTASSLEIDYNSLRREIARYLAWGTDLDADQRQAVDDIMAAGYRSFLYPTLPGSIRPHSWSFLKPTASLGTTEDVGEYDLADGFASIFGDLTFESSDDAWQKVRLTTLAAMREHRQQDSEDFRGQPVLAAVEALPPNAATGSRFRLWLWPIPDQEYTLTYRYLAQPNNLTEQNPRPYGSAQFGNCLIAAVLSAAEERYNDGQTQWRSRYQEALANAIGQDIQSAPEYLGYNGDWFEENRWRSLQRRPGTVTYTPSS